MKNKLLFGFRIIVLLALVAATNVSTIQAFTTTAVNNKPQAPNYPGMPHPILYDLRVRQAIALPTGCP